MEGGAERARSGHVPELIPCSREAGGEGADAGDTPFSARQDGQENLK